MNIPVNLDNKIFDGLPRDEIRKAVSKAIAFGDQDVLDGIASAMECLDPDDFPATADELLEHAGWYADRTVEIGHEGMTLYAKCTNDNCPQREATDA